MTVFVYVTSAVLLATSGAPAKSEAATETLATTPKEEVKKKKITDRNHPDYVRCRNQKIIGSLAKKRRVCMTNAQWAAHIREGNRRTGEMIEEGRAGTNGN